MDSQQLEGTETFPHGRYIQYDGTSLRKDIIIEYSDGPSEQFQANIPYNSQTRELDLGMVLHNHLIEIIPPGYKYQVFYYSNDFEYFVFGGMYPFQQVLILDQQYVADAYLFIKLNKVHPPQTSEQFQVSKKKRKNDRTIKQMLEKVSKWRKLQQKNEITFEEAAKIVGIPKKTLDDYFRHIKQGQTYNFNFEQNQHEKVGFLRKFVRQNHKKQDCPLKILQDFMKDDEINHEDDEEQQQEQYGEQ